MTHIASFSKELLRLTAADVACTNVTNVETKPLIDPPDGWSWWDTAGDHYCLVQTSGRGVVYHTVDFRYDHAVIIWTHLFNDPKALSRLEILRPRTNAGDLGQLNSAR